MTSRTIRVLAVDDHPLLRDGIAALIASKPDLELVAEAANGEEAVEAYRRARPDVTLMDLQLPGMSGIDTIAAIRQEFPDARIIVLTTFSGDILAKRALQAGAQAYLLKETVRKDLLETIRAVHAGQRRINAEVAQQIAGHTMDDPMSTREVAVLTLVAAGNSNKSIGRELQITEATVKSHVRSILSKLGAKDRTHAVTLARERGIIDV